MVLTIIWSERAAGGGTVIPSASALSAARSAHSAVWEAIQRDCESVAGADKTKIAELPLDHLPLWPDRQNPLQDEWDSLKATLPKSSPARSDETARGPVPVDWGFWVKWYDSVLDGKPLKGDMLVEIAKIKGGDWEKGEARISFLIGEIEQRYAAKASPYPERLSYDGEYKSTPTSDLPSATLQDACERIADVARSMRASGNQYAALQDEADLLDDYLKRYPERAIRLFEICHKVVRHISAHVENGVLPENDNLIGDVLGDLQNSADDIYNFDALVRETVDARAKLRFGALDQEQRDGIKGFAEAVAQNSEAGLAGELREDAAEVMDEQDPEGESKPARYRLGSRLVRVLAMGGEGLYKVYKLLGVAATAWGGGTALWELAKVLIGF